MAATLSLAGGASAQSTIPKRCKTAPGGVPAAKINNLEAIIDDSGSMLQRDPNRLRIAGIEEFIRNPENSKKTFGVVEFGTNAATVFGRAKIGPARSTMISLLRSQIRGDDGSTNYDKAFLKGAQDNPAAEGRIFITDGAHDGVYMNSHRGGPRTFVVGLGIGRPGPSNPNANRLQQIAAETGGVYFPGVSAATLQPTIATISAAINCLPKPRSFRSARFKRKGQKSTRTVKITPGTKRFELALNWAQPRNRFALSSVSLLGKKNRVLATLTGKGKPRKIRAKRGSAKTLRTLAFAKSRGALKLRFTVTAKRLRKRERTITQLTERTD